MTAAIRCPDCGALEVPWSRGHAKTCGSYVPPEVLRRCRCGGEVRINDVDVPASHVVWRCEACRTTWREDCTDTDTDEHLETA